MYSQENRIFIDSLKKFIATAPDDSNKVNAIYKLGTQYNLFKSKEHIPQFISALNLSKKIGHKNNRAKIYLSLVTTLFYNNIYDLGMEYALEGLTFIQKEGQPHEQFILHGMLGNLCSKLGKYEKGKHYYYELLTYKKNNNDQVGWANTHVNIAIGEMDQRNYDSAIWHLSKAEIILKRNNKQAYTANCVLGLAEAYLAKEDFISATQKALESHAMYSISNNIYGITNCTYVLGAIKQKKGEHKQALEYFERSRSLADSLKLVEARKDSYKNLAIEYAMLNDHKAAYENLTLFKQYDDSLDIEKQKGKMLEMEVKYDITKKENLLLEQTAEIESQNKQRNFLLLGLSAILLLLFISFRAYKQKKNSADIIAKQKHLVEDKQKEILDSINYAKRIQNAILAREEDIKKHLPESFLLYRPKDIIAGDFYFFEVTNTHIFYAAADCTGHGVPGALMSVVCSNSLTRCVKEFGLVKPGEILDKTRELVVETLKKSGEEVKDGMDISLIAFSRKNMQKDIEWAGANNPLWYIKSNVLVEIKADKQPIGLYDEPKPFTSHSISLDKGDMIFLFTDGYADQFGGPKAKKFKYKQFQEVLESISSKSSTEQVKILEDKFINWKGELEQVDDVCVVGIRI